jgi:hypothetical protein
MPSVARPALLLGLLTLAAPAAALPDIAPEELDHNRQLLARWRTDADHYARLKRDLQAFKALPPERQTALRRLDHDLHQEDPAAQARLLLVMDRYAAWLDSLAPADRQQIEAAADTAERLRVIRQVREREWIDRLPRATRDQVLKAAPDKRAALLADLRRLERDRHLAWQGAQGAEDAPARPWPPTRPGDLPSEVQNYVTFSLIPRLNKEDKERLKNAQGQSPMYARTLLELAEKHPVFAPGDPGPTSISELPRDVKERVQQLPAEDRRRLNRFVGHWPEFGIAVTAAVRKEFGTMPRELGPCHPKDLPPPLQQFLDTKLLPKLPPEGQRRLAEAEGRWPDYPRMILELSRRRGLQVPGATLPGPPDFWSRLRAAVADEKGAK